MRRQYRYRGRSFVPRDVRIARNVAAAQAIRKAGAHTKDAKEIEEALHSPTQPALFS